MTLPTVKHGRIFRIKDVGIQLVTFDPLPDELAARVAMYLWRTEASVRKSKGKVLTVHWLGDADTAAMLPPLQPQRR